MQEGASQSRFCEKGQKRIEKIVFCSTFVFLAAVWGAHGVQRYVLRGTKIYIAGTYMWFCIGRESRGGGRGRGGPIKCNSFIYIYWLIVNI